MIKNRSRLAVVTLSILLAFTTSAYAECAWVLWSSMKSRPSATDWEIEGTWPNATPCFAEISHQKRAVEAANKAGNDIYINEHGSRGSWITFVHPGGTTFQFRCLPDTVDPRGQKGGGR